MPAVTLPGGCTEATTRWVDEEKRDTTRRPFKMGSRVVVRGWENVLLGKDV